MSQRDVRSDHLIPGLQRRRQRLDARRTKGYAMPLDHYVTLGRSGLRVSPLCLGAMTFGEDWGWGSSVEESVAVLNRYVELGGNFIDTANAYTFGHSETIIGDYIAADPSRRQRLVI